MLKLVIGNNFEKRLIYQALSVLDTDGNKKVSLEELLRFIYRIWKSQLDELADKLTVLDDRVTGGKQMIDQVLRERERIKDCLKKNFPREWRDRLEREGGHRIPGPFQSLLQRMDIHANKKTSSSLSPPSSSSLQFQSKLTDTNGLHYLNLDSPSHHHQQQHNSNSLNNTNASSNTNGRSSSSSGSRHVRNTTNSGQSAVLRMKIKIPAAEEPNRTSMKLSVPAVYNMNNMKIDSSEATGSILKINPMFY